LNRFIADPMRVLPGTDMEAHGYQKLEDRADLIAYLRTQSDTPLPLPAN
jgi:cytochrome c